MGGERGKGGEEGGVIGGNIVEGKPIEVRLISAVSLFARGRQDQIGGS